MAHIWKERMLRCAGNDVTIQVTHGSATRRGARYKASMITNNNNKHIIMEKKYERVYHPNYYMDESGVECIDVARHKTFNVGNALKYLWRAGRKHEDGIDDVDKEIEDLQKAVFYLNDEITRLEVLKRTTCNGSTCQE